MQNLWLYFSNLWFEFNIIMIMMIDYYFVAVTYIGYLNIFFNISVMNICIMHLCICNRIDILSTCHPVIFLFCLYCAYGKRVDMTYDTRIWFTHLEGKNCSSACNFHSSQLNEFGFSNFFFVWIVKCSCLCLDNVNGVEFRNMKSQMNKIKRRKWYNNNSKTVTKRNF